MRMVRSTGWYVGSMLAAALLAGCAGQSRLPAQDEVKEAPAEVKPEFEYESNFPGLKRANIPCEQGKEHWRASGTPKRGGTFLLAEIGSNTHLDVSTGLQGIIYTIPRVYEGLVEARGCYFQDTETVPGLAKSWQFSPDGLSLTFKLRDDVKWHNKAPVNGRKFTAADVAWTVELQKQGGVLRSFFDGVNHEEPDPYTVVFRFQTPQPDFLKKMAFPTAVILPHEVKEQLGDFKNVAIGTGPFMLTSFKPREEAVVERNPDYYRMGQDSKPIPYFDTVKSIAMDNASQFAALKTGQLDYHGASTFEIVNGRRLIQEAPKLRYWSGPVSPNWGIYFNNQVKPFDDVRVRRAIALAVDFDAVIATSRSGGATRAGYIPSALRDWAWSQAMIKEKFKQDPERSKQLLRDAGYGPGELKFTMKAPVAGPGVQDAQLIQAQLKAVGIEAQLEPDRDITTNVLSRKYSITNSLFSNFPFPDHYLKGELRTGSSQNFTNFSDPKIDALIDAESRETDPSKRKQMIDQLQNALVELMPYHPGLNPMFYMFLSCKTQNMKTYYVYFGLTGLEEAWFDPEKC